MAKEKTNEAKTKETESEAGSKLPKGEIKASETTDEVQSEEVNMIKVSDLQPKRSKPGYPQELKNNAGFGYNPAKNK